MRDAVFISEARDPALPEGDFGIDHPAFRSIKRMVSQDGLFTFQQEEGIGNPAFLRLDSLGSNLETFELSVTNEPEDSGIRPKFKETRIRVVEGRGLPGDRLRLHRLKSPPKTAFPWAARPGR